MLSCYRVCSWICSAGKQKAEAVAPACPTSSWLWVGGYDAIVPRTSRPARRAGRYAYSRCVSIIDRITGSIVEAVAPVDLAGLPEAVAVLLRDDALLNTGRRAELQLDKAWSNLGVADD